MAHIIEILGADNHVSYAIVHVLLDNGEEAEVYIGGDVETWYDPKYGKCKAYIKRRKEHTGIVNEDQVSKK